MLKIRLKRTGRRGQPHYRVVIMESSQPRDGKTVEEIGYYNPRQKPSVFDIDKDRAKYWLEKGAQPSDTVRQYFVKEGLLESLERGSTKPNTTKGSKKDKKEE
ncbi:MAG: 30S ribosomal protein S16 [Candidatus Dojkabacteria bacterium]|nr:30S ribosomal protein S16 [Candidatus Dojkabacteria bacterium]